MWWKTKSAEQKKKELLDQKLSSHFDFVSSKSIDYKQLFFTNKHDGKEYVLIFISTLIDDAILQKDILPYLYSERFTTLENVKQTIPIPDIEYTKDVTELEKKLFHGYALLKQKDTTSPLVFISAPQQVVRSVTQPEIEFSVVGPKEAFVESMDMNVNLIRKRLPIKELTVEQYEVGSLSQTRISLAYIKGIANEENVETFRQRLRAIDFDLVTDSSYVEQLLADNVNSIFPQLLDTERPDRVVGVLAEGKVVAIVDGSPHALVGPTTLVEFFSSFDDYYMNWFVSSFFRMVRLFAVAFSILISPIYVAALTFHYELIPKDLLATLITSRQAVPLPPLLEALFLELTIELLREAGARLPTKVGQTIGIVGGIVIGTASVEAGITSNILLIIVALSALASFTTPIYKIGNIIRILRFPFLFMAAIWGLLGIVFCFCVLLTHLLRLTSLGRPYLEPLFPPRLFDMKDAFIRFPFGMQFKRPGYLRTKQPVRFAPSEGKRKLDIDE